MLLAAAAGTLLAAVIAGAAFFHLRHLGLLASVLLLPAPGLAAAAFVAPLRASTGTTFLGLAYLMGLSAALLLADDFARLVCDGTDAKSATHAVLRGRGRVLGGFVAALAAAILAPAMIGGAAALALRGAALVAAAGLSVIAGFYLVRFLPYSENFVTRQNRMHERWYRIFDRSIAVARPRWGFSVAGIALVFAVLGFFGAQTLTVPAETAGQAAAVFPAVALVTLASISLAIRDWRTILATALALCPPVLLGLWGLARLALPLGAANLLLLVLALGIGAVPLVTAGAEMGRAGRSGGDATIAAARTLLRSGPGFFFAAALPALALLLAVPLLGDVGFALAAVIVFAGSGALLFQPAFAIAVETWFPRPATVAARYRLS